MTPCPKCGSFLCERTGGDADRKSTGNATVDAFYSVFGDIFGSRRNECCCRVCGARFTQAADKASNQQ